MADERVNRRTLASIAPIRHVSLELVQKSFELKPERGMLVPQLP
jgi:hypothetical protein